MEDELPRLKTLSRTEYRDAVINLLDLGFTPPAIAYMVGKTDVSIYALLTRLGRKTGRNMVRRKPLALNPYAASFMSRLFSEPERIAGRLLLVAQSSKKQKPLNGGLSSPAMASLARD